MDAAKSEQDRSQAETPRLTIAMDGERRDRASTGLGPSAGKVGAAAIGLSRKRNYYIVSGVHVDPTTGGTGMLDAAGGVIHGMLVKSKKSNKSGCAASRFVRCADGPMKRFSTNLMIAV